MEALICARDVEKRFSNGVKALNGVSLEVAPGEIYCLLGPNGAGKSTLINIFLDFIRPTSGSTMINSISCQDQPGLAKREMAYLPDNVQLFGELRALETLRFFAALGGRETDSHSLRRCFEMVQLDDSWATEFVGNFSRGMRQKLGLAILLARDASVFLLDEPLVGIDPKSSRDILETILQMKSLGKSFLLTTHDLLRARTVADRVGILDQGILVAEYSGDQLHSLDLEATYLDHLG